MPVMDGYAAISHIRNHAVDKAVKIIAVTASAFGDTSRDALGAGADDLIIKPFREEELFEKMGNLLGAEYVYGQEIPPAAAAAAAEDTGAPPGAITGLPRELAARLREAAINGDFQLLLDLTGQVEARDIRMAGILRALAGKFDTQRILNLLAKD